MASPMASTSLRSIPRRSHSFCSPVAFVTPLIPRSSQATSVIPNAMECMSRWRTIGPSPSSMWSLLRITTRTTGSADSCVERHLADVERDSLVDEELAGEEDPVGALHGEGG